MDLELKKEESLVEDKRKDKAWKTHTFQKAHPIGEVAVMA